MISHSKPNLPSAKEHPYCAATATDATVEIRSDAVSATAVLKAGSARHHSRRHATARHALRRRALAGPGVVDHPQDARSLARGRLALLPAPRRQSDVSAWPAWAASWTRPRTWSADRTTRSSASTAG